MEKIKKIKLIIATIVIIAITTGVAVYWFKYRPKQVQQECKTTAKEFAKAAFKAKATTEETKNNPQFKNAASGNVYLPADYGSSYKECLSKHWVKN
ncbi:MAG: hypothetical protein WCI36_01200 [bacterium]